MHRVAHTYARLRARTPRSLLYPPPPTAVLTRRRLSPSRFLSRRSLRLFLRPSSYPRASLSIPLLPERLDIVTFFSPVRLLLAPPPSPRGSLLSFLSLDPRPPFLPIMLPYCLRLLSLTPKPVQIASSPRVHVYVHCRRRAPLRYLRFSPTPRPPQPSPVLLSAPGKGQRTNEEDAGRLITVKRHRS